MKGYFTVMLRISSSRYEREWYVENFRVSDSCYRFQLENNLAFKTFEACRVAIDKKIDEFGGRYVDYIPKVGVKDKYRVTTAWRSEKTANNPSLRI
jgi:hypothetical protein